MRQHLLDKELAIYKREKSRLLAQSEGKFVLIKGEEVIGVFTSQEDALQEGYKRFGNTEFLIKLITSQEEIANFSRTI